MAAAITQSMSLATVDGRSVYPDIAALESIVGNSIDYAVMERTERAALVDADMGWSDIGNWEALRSVLPQDENGNAAKGAHELVRCKDVLAFTDGPRVTVMGLEGVLVIVQNGEVVVVGQNEAQNVGKLASVVQS